MAALFTETCEVFTVIIAASEASASQVASIRMLAAERYALKWEAYTGALGIQEREMEVIANYLQNLGNQAALVAGFALTCYTAEMGFPSDTVHPVFEGIFFCCVSTSISMMLFCVVTSTLVISMGPAMGLRGKDGTSMRVAVEHMKSSRSMIRQSFEIGCVSFFAAIFQLVWHKVSHRANSSMCTVICTLVFVFLYNSVKRIFSQFGHDENGASSVTGTGVVPAATYIAKADSSRPQAAYSVASGPGVQRLSAMT